jgi:hypothetical protein
VAAGLEELVDAAPPHSSSCCSIRAVAALLHWVLDSLSARVVVRVLDSGRHSAPSLGRTVPPSDLGLGRGREVAPDGGRRRAKEEAEARGHVERRAVGRRE